ncbi:fungal-specific transcription factor domain-domain-containing protein [Syncephalastrum racemosum]|uniref:Fungal-specific transcription factor domain-domain-containing protein n=1 Tax=Syncephalastrum racemosum TaxID=13706 RepID=A0A1X2HGC5_SYNRA|nr:fungal-specific transcription factor domain-domain-containing protein [Syncephalastrum racemosum]
MESSTDSRNKRLKVGRACYTCRAKKIKCDGLRPCMQCKARNRPCTFYKDGSFDPVQEPLEETSGTTSSPPGSGSDPLNVAENPAESDLLFSDTKDSNYTRNKRRGPPLESRASNVLATLGDGLRKLTLYDGQGQSKAFQDSEPFGSFIKWLPESPLPSRYTGSIEMPPRDAQMQMLEQFFTDQYEVLPIIPRRYMFDQLRCKGPFITPLLLNAIYARASRFCDIAGLPTADVFFHRAKRLLDDFLDVPRTSTVVALLYMSLYEHPPTTHRAGNQHCRSWIYSGMAFRMCIELGLFTQENISKDLSPDEIALRRRIFWACYCLDKFQSGGWERPWMLPDIMCQVDKLECLTEEDPDERVVLDGLRCKVELTELAAEGMMHLRRIWTGDDSDYKDHQEALQNRFQSLLRAFPPYLQFTPTGSLSVEEVLRLPQPRPMVVDLHLLYNVCVLDILARSPNNAYNQFQRRVYATCVTQLAHFAVERPSAILKFDFVMHALIMAIKVHAKNLYNADMNLARQSWSMFDKSVMIIHKLRQYAIIPNSTKFLQQLGSTMEAGVPGSMGPRNTNNAGDSSSNAAHAMESYPPPPAQQHQHADYGSSMDDYSMKIYMDQQQQQQQAPQTQSTRHSVHGDYDREKAGSDHDFVVLSMGGHQDWNTAVAAAAGFHGPSSPQTPHGNANMQNSIMMEGFAPPQPRPSSSSTSSVTSSMMPGPSPSRVDSSLDIMTQPPTPLPLRHPQDVMLPQPGVIMSSHQQTHIAQAQRQQHKHSHSQQSQQQQSTASRHPADPQEQLYDPHHPSWLFDR